MALQNGSACHLFLIHKYFDNFVKKWSNQCIHDLIKKDKQSEPFCRASILARTQRQLPFSQGHFVGFSSSSPSSLILFGGGTNLFRVCDEHQAREGQHGGILGRRRNLNVLKRFRANHCKHKCALTKWYMYWNDGFSTEWLADFSLSMTNSHFFKPPNHSLKKPPQNGFWFVTKWFLGAHKGSCLQNKNDKTS